MCKQQYKPHDRRAEIPPPNFKILSNKGNRVYTDVPHVNYLYPVDNDEANRVHYQHDLCIRTWGSLFSAPVHELLSKGAAQVLDVGCGPGNWTLDAAAKYPRSKFTGVDIVPIYPTTIKPINAEFRQVDVVTGLPYKDNTFDFVICRFMNFSYTKNDWKVVIKEISRVCKIGGYVEFTEKDVKFENEGDYTKEARIRFNKKLRKKNFEPIISPVIKDFIKETRNYSEIQHEKQDVPLGKWGGEIGESGEYIFKWSAENLRDVMIRSNDYRGEEWDEIVKRVVEELNENRCYDYIHRIWAKKICHQQEKESREMVCKCSSSSSSRWLNFIFKKNISAC